MLFMVVEGFKDRNVRAVYARFRAEGRRMPEGLTYVNSWVAADFERCFVLVECDDARLLQRWVAAWADLVEFEFVPVVASQDAAAAVADATQVGTRRTGARPSRRRADRE